MTDFQQQKRMNQQRAIPSTYVTKDDNIYYFVPPHSVQSTSVLKKIPLKGLNNVSPAKIEKKKKKISLVINKEGFYKKLSGQKSFKTINYTNLCHRSCGNKECQQYRLGRLIEEYEEDMLLDDEKHNCVYCGTCPKHQILPEYFREKKFFVGTKLVKTSVYYGYTQFKKIMEDNCNIVNTEYMTRLQKYRNSRNKEQK